MKQPVFFFEDVIIPEAQIYIPDLNVYLAYLSLMREKKYETQYAALYLPYDDILYTKVKQLAFAKLQYQPTYVVVIGIGGSSLGAKAVYQALYHHKKDYGAQLLFLESPIEDEIKHVSALLEKAALEQKKSLLVVISKSGKTLETVDNFSIMQTLFQQWYPQSYKDLIVAITDYDSPLYHKAQQCGYDVLEIPQEVGGRYSVLSAVGILPLALVGVDIDQLRQGALMAAQILFTQDKQNNHAVQVTSALWHYYQQGYRIYDTFVFHAALEGLAQWQRQLIGESLGKEQDLHGRHGSYGFLPTVSLGPQDLHSVAQFYLSGNRSMYTEFLDVQAKENTNYQQYPFLQAMQHTYAYKKKPYSSWIFPELSAYYFGYYFYTKMVEVMLFAHLLQVNPFDQPDVEFYKYQLRKLKS